MRRMLLAALVASLLPAASYAQNSSLFNQGSGGRAGGTTGASSSRGGASGGLFNQTTGGTGSQASATGSGGALDATATGGSSSSNSSSNAVGQGTTNAVGTASGQQVMGADSIGNSAFTGRTENSRFIGVRTTTTNPQQSGLNAFSQIFQGLQRAGQQGSRNGGQSQNDRLPLRPTLRVGFDFNPTTASATVSSPQFASRFSGIAERRPQLANVNVMTDDGGRVVLRGTVATEDSKNLAAALLRLEPGVREVVNELNVESPAAE